MALFFERMRQCVQKVLDTADIVREAMFSTVIFNPTTNRCSVVLQHTWTDAMLRLYPFSWPLVIAFALLQSPLSAADTCVLYHKCAPVNAVCGTVIDPTGERLKDVELTLTDEKGSVVFSTHSDA